MEVAKEIADKILEFKKVNKTPNWLKNYYLEMKKYRYKGEHIL